jgi:peptidylprolyl isomerase
MMESRRKSRPAAAAALAAAILLGQVACMDTTGPAVVECDPLLVQADAAWALAAASDTTSAELGLQYIDMKVGTGAVAQLGMIAEVNYSGYLTNRQLFESSCVFGGQTFQFQLGAGTVIPGFESGIVGMRDGGVRRLIIPPHLGYPEGGTLIFDVQLASLRISP